jgi:pimeloyl-ACP methyl ester carboxylesterase
LAHVNARDTTLVYASRAPQKDIERLKARMGWTMPWYTLTDHFDKDFGVDENHGHNAFIRDGDRVFRTYFTNWRGDEVMGTTWSYLDMTALGRQETSVDLPGIGKSSPSATGYDTAHMAADIHTLVCALNLEQPYIVGHDLGGLTTYAYVRQFPGTLRGAMILDIPIPGLDGWEEATSAFWHIRFIQEPGEFAEKLVVGRQEIFLGWSFAMGAFTADERNHYVESYGAPQIHAAFEIYRAFPEDSEWNAAKTDPNDTPLVVAVGEKSFFAKLLPTFVDGYRAKGMSRVDGIQIPGSGHCVLADNPEAVAEVIEKYAS